MARHVSDGAHATPLAAPPLHSRPLAQVRYCDREENPRYNGRQDDPVNPINCTWGFHRPPQLPESEPTGGTCTVKDPEAILAARRAEPKRSWSGGGRRSEFGGSKGRQSWSTRDRPGYLYRNYM